MDHIDARLLHPRDVSLTEKENALRSLEVLIQLIGSHLNSFRPKVMATLKLVLQYPSLVKLACRVWYTFVSAVDVSQLGPLLSRIIVDLVRTRRLIYLFIELYPSDYHFSCLM